MSAYFEQRLRDNAAKAAGEYARIAARHADLVERGVDTSKPAPAQSPDQTLGKAEARAAFAERALQEYLTRDTGK